MKIDHCLNEEAVEALAILDPAKVLLGYFAIFKNIRRTCGITILMNAISLRSR